ncbi:hypothetical protein EDB84DRAFT_712702 [Lactarius hengduanensis]|nr:hypothetical protein EDB84DRAFT_712702 [Lactarius hengduanensis]
MGNQKLGWMAISFGRNMDDSPMVVVWPSCGADGEYNSVALSQRKVPYEVMLTPDPHPPFALAHRYLCACSPRLFPSSRSVQATLENPRIVFTRNNIIWAIQPHAGIGGLGCSHININTPQNWPQHAQLWRASLPSLLSHQSHPPLLPQYIHIPIPKAKMMVTTTTRKQKMRVKATMTRVVEAVLQVSCTARSVPWGSCSCYCLAWSWPDMQKRREVPGCSCCTACFHLASVRASSPSPRCASLNCVSFSRRVHNRRHARVSVHA